MRHLKVTTETDRMLTELSAKRKSECALVRTKQDIAAEAIQALYRKEQRK